MKILNHVQNTPYFSKCTANPDIYPSIHLQLTLCIVVPCDFVSLCCLTEGNASCFTNIDMNLHIVLLFRFQTLNTDLSRSTKRSQSKFCNRR